MNAILLLFIIGALLLAAEVFLPGAIAGIIGGCLLVLGSALAFNEYGLGVGAMATSGAVLLLGVMLFIELVWLPRSKLGRDMVVQTTVVGQSQPPLASREVIGQRATALTTLAPSGVVEIAGKRYEAYCRSGHATRGAALTVVDVDNFRLVVSESTPS
jgi:membrane-bound serine protease (ClpP class)